MKKNWKIIQPDKKSILDFSEKLNVHPVIARLLANRGINDIDEGLKFLNPSLNDLHDPFRMKDMDKAVLRIIKAISNKEKILIHGDYDVDGMTSVALFVKYLRKLGADIDWYIPNRLQEGYGLGQSGVEYAKKKNISLLVTADCGILAFDCVKILNENNIDVIITDHHQPNDKLPDAYAILNPLRNDCNYPYKGLAGVGIIFKLCQSLEYKINKNDSFSFKFLDLVALGTVADVSMMTGENKILAKHGLENFRELNNIGLKTLLKVVGLKNNTISTRDIGFILAPRLNASGRLGMADKSLNLLLTEDKNQAEKLSLKLNNNNKVRQNIQNKTFREAVQQVEDSFDFSKDNIIMVYGKHWHAGVIGIVASKLVDKYFKPALVMCGKENLIQGSGRSIEDLHLYDAISQCRHNLESFGGHEMACGITLNKNNITKFREELNSIIGEDIEFKEIIPSINIDMQLGFSNLNMKFIKDLGKIAPFGIGNPEPVFYSANLRLKNKPQYLKRKGLKLWLSDGDFTFKAIGFGDYFINKNLREDDNLHVAYSPYIDTWQGRRSIGLKMKDIKIK